MKALKVIALLVFVSSALFISGLWLLHGYPLYKIRKDTMSEIEFYGRIVAQDGHPIEGVSLIAEWDKYPENLFAYFFARKSNRRREKLMSDSNGRFAITGLRGVRLVLRDFSHPTYELPGKKRGWGFSFISDSNNRHVADSRNPFTITMRDATSSASPNNNSAQTTASPSSGL